MDEANDRLFLLELLLHTADVTNCCKPFEIGKEWGRLIAEEMFAQGDKERSLNLPVSPMMDREGADLALLQMGFMEFVVGPLLIRKCGRHVIMCMLLMVLFCTWCMSLRFLFTLM